MSRILRADRALVERGLVASRSLAQRLIDDRAVRVIVGASGARVIERASQPIDRDDALEVLDSFESRFVSRAGAKLDGLLQTAGIDCAGLTVLDCGMSTGGFAHCLLERGAARIVGIEVGHGQLAPALQSVSAIRCFEKTHIRSVDRTWLDSQGLAPFDMIVSDLSFISSVGLLARLAALAAPDALLAMLVKPQFELGPRALDARGVVRRDADLDALRDDALAAALAAGWADAAWHAAQVAGGDGNREFFLVARRAECHAGVASH